MSPDKTSRLWAKACLQIPRKRPRKRVAATRPRPQLPIGVNDVWAYDFVFDACADWSSLLAQISTTRDEPLRVRPSAGPSLGVPLALEGSHVLQVVLDQKLHCPLQVFTDVAQHMPSALRVGVHLLDYGPCP